MKRYKIIWVPPLLVLGLYLTWVYASRWQSNRDFIASRQPPAPSLPPGFGHGLRIIQFYASPPRVTAGQAALVCYGVEDATSVKLTPPVHDVSPGYNHCFEVRPAQPTSYKLEAWDAQGHKDSAEFRIDVRPEAKR